MGSTSLIAFGNIFVKATGGDTQLKSTLEPIGSLKSFKMAGTHVTGPPERDRRKVCPVTHQALPPLSKLFLRALHSSWIRVINAKDCSIWCSRSVFC